MEDFIEVVDGKVTGAFATVLSIELNDVGLMMDEQDTPITEDEWLAIVDYLGDMIGQDLQEHMAMAIDGVLDARLKKQILVK